MDIIDSPKSIPKEIGRGTILDRWRLPDGTLYLDNAATRPMLPEVAEEMARLMANNPLNASSQHKYGQKAARILKDARNFFKSELNVPSTGELIFNSGATEGLNMLLKSAYFADPTKNHIVTVKTEHKAVLNTCAYLETIGAEVTYLDVDEWGQVSVSDIEAAIRPATCAVCVMWVNNETGLIHDIELIGSICKSRGVKFLCDITQGFSKLKFDLSKLNVDGVAVSGHKFGALPGVGFIATKHHWTLPMMHGGGQEFGQRSGTQPVLSCHSMHVAFQSYSPLDSDVIEAANSILQKMIPMERLMCSIQSLPNIQVWNLLAPKESEAIKWSFSKGSACSGRHVERSHVFRLLSLPENAIRISF